MVLFSALEMQKSPIIHFNQILPTTTNEYKTKHSTPEPLKPPFDWLS